MTTKSESTGLIPANSHAIPIPPFRNHLTSVVLIPSTKYHFHHTPALPSPSPNRNIEKQAITRVYRQGQTRTVLYMMLNGSNSDVDKYMNTVKDKKDEVNQILMEPLVRRHDQGPAEIPII